MKVKSVLSQAAANLGREDLVAQIEDCASEPTGDLAALLRCFNLVENEIALDYFPLKREELLCAPHGTVPFRRFRFAPLSVVKVEDCAGRTLPFELKAACLFLPGYCARGRVRVVYTYSPVEKCFFGESSFGGRISARLLSFGVASEFCLARGQYAEAATWEKKYREALRAAGAVRKKLTVRGRRWE